MFYLVLAIALLNIALGYAVGVYWLNTFGTGVHIPPPAPEADDEEPIVVTQKLASEEIPSQWHEILEDVAESATFVEAAVHVFRLEVGKYRDQLISIDDRVRKCIETPDETQLQHCLDDLKNSNEAYLSRQDGARAHLTERQQSLGVLSDIGTQLEDVLLEQAAQIETAVSNIDVLDFDSDISEGCRRLLKEIDKLLYSCHALRDQMHEALLAVVVAEGRLAELDVKLKTDELTNLPNRTGIENVFKNFRDADPRRERVASLAIFDIDGLSKINRAQGPRFGDQVIEACGRAIDKAMRKKRGHDVASRFEGQRFLVFFGDTGPRNATSGIERIRQTIAASTFVCGELELELTVSCGVAEMAAGEPFKEACRRAGKAALAAKSAGRNRTFLDVGEGPEPVEVTDLNVTGHIITLDG